MDLAQRVRAHATQNIPTYLDSLCLILRERPVSAEKNPAEMRSASELIKDALRYFGLGNIKTLQTDNSHPAVYGEYLSPNPNAPTLLVQGHFDGQPSVESRWKVTSPHEPLLVLDGGERRLYGRGSSDDLGQVFTHLAAINFYQRNELPFPINVKFLVEGGEESGSRDMDKLVAAHKDLLQADVVMITDSAPGRMDHPVITTSGRGIVKMDVTLKTGTANPHSGENIARNAVATLAALLTSMKDYGTGLVNIPHFYDNVAVLPEGERAKLVAMPYDVALFQRNYGLQEVVVEHGFTIQETMWARPSFELHDLTGGQKANIIPTEANAYVTMRLVPHQHPDRIAELFAAELSSRAQLLGINPQQLTIAKVSGAHPFSTQTVHPAFALAEQAMQAAFGASVDYMGCGGTEPIAVVHQQVLRAPVIFNAYNSPSDHYHGDDESFSLDKGFIPGTVANVLFYELLGQSKKS